MPAFEMKQTDDSQTQPPYDHRAREKGLLKNAGFEPTQDGLWERDGVYYSQEAAWQQAWRELHSGDSYLY